MLNRITNITTYLSKATEGFKPEVGIVIGSGLGDLASALEVEYTIDYSSIEGMPLSTVVGHKGQFIFGNLEGKRVVVMSGRFHFYEGYTPQEVVIGVRIFKMLGVETLLLSNAAGAVNKSYKVGDIMVITDHISFIPNPLIGENLAQLGERFPAMNNCYTSSLIALSKGSGVSTHFGVYGAMTGPSYETSAEINFLRVIGADSVGMSTAPEVVAASHCSMKVFAASLITNETGSESPPTHQEVMAESKKGSRNMERLFRYVIANL